MLITLSDRRFQSLVKNQPQVVVDTLTDIRDTYSHVQSLNDLTSTDITDLYFTYVDLCNFATKDVNDMLLGMDFLSLLADESKFFGTKKDLTTFLFDISEVEYKDLGNPDLKYLQEIYSPSVIEGLFPAVFDYVEFKTQEQVSSRTEDTSSQAQPNPQILEDVYTLYLQEDTSEPEFTPVYLQSSSRRAAGEYIKEHYERFMDFFSVMSGAEDGSNLALDLIEQIGYFPPDETDPEILSQLETILEEYDPEDILLEMESGRWGGPELRV